MLELEQFLSRMRGEWLGGGAALAHCPPEWKPIVGDDSYAELKLAALAGQAMQVAFRPTAGSPVQLRPPLPALALPTMAESLRPRVRRLLAAYRQSPRFARATLVLLAARGFTVHPADWMPSANDTSAPDVYAPWTDWAARFAPQDDQEEISSETWSDWPPAARRIALAKLRLRDPDAAREIIAKSAGGEPAEKRVDIVALLASRLSERDADYLASLSTDRSEKVKAVARNLLARLGRGDTPSDLAAELAGFMSVGKTGLLARKTAVTFTKLQNAAQKNRRSELFRQVTYTALAQQLGLSEDELSQAIAIDDLEAVSALSEMLGETAPEAVIGTIVGRMLDEKQAHPGPIVMLAQRLPREDRLSLAPKVAARDNSSFSITPEFVGDALGALPLAVFSGSQPWRDFSVSMMAWAAGGENVDAAERAAKLGLTHLGFLLDAESAAALLAQTSAAGLSQSDPALDLLHLNAALKPETST